MDVGSWRWDSPAYKQLEVDASGQPCAQYTPTLTEDMHLTFTQRIKGLDYNGFCLYIYIWVHIL